MLLISSKVRKSFKKKQKTTLTKKLILCEIAPKEPKYWMFNQTLQSNS